jgi:hypothetical protein
LCEVVARAQGRSSDPPLSGAGRKPGHWNNACLRDSGRACARPRICHPGCRARAGSCSGSESS